MVKISSSGTTDLGSSIQTFNVHMLLLKNLKFLTNYYKTRSKSSTYEYLILTEFHNHWVKIVDFLIKAYVYYESLNWGAQVCTLRMRVWFSYLLYLVLIWQSSKSVHFEENPFYRNQFQKSYSVDQISGKFFNLIKN